MPSRLPHLLRLGVALLALGMLAAGCNREGAPVVDVERVSSGTVVETISAPASVEAAARQDVAASLSGTVAVLEVEDGAAVEAGDVILRLDSSQVDLAQQQAEAAAAAAGAGAGISVPGGGAAARVAAEEAAADLDRQVQPSLDRARERAEAIEDEDQRAAAEAAIEAAESAYLSTRATVLATGRALADQQDALARSLAEALNQALTQATAPQRAQARAAAEAAAAQADELVVTAPFAGTIRLGEAAASDGLSLPGVPAELSGLAGSFGGSLGGAGAGGGAGGGTLRAGAPVSAGQVLFTVLDLSQRYVSADVDEIDAPAVAVGQRAIVLVDALPDLDFDAVVEAVDLEATTTDAGGVGYRARLRLIGPRTDGASRPARNDDDLLDGVRVGMTASAEITTDEVEGDLVVPSRALVRRDGGTVVLVVRDGTLTSIPVDVLALGEDRAAVGGELTGDDLVAVSGYDGLADGTEVQTRNAARAEADG